MWREKRQREGRDKEREREREREAGRERRVERKNEHKEIMTLTQEQAVYFMVAQQSQHVWLWRGHVTYIHYLFIP